MIKFFRVMRLTWLMI